MEIGSTPGSNQAIANLPLSTYDGVILKTDRFNPFTAGLKFLIVRNLSMAGFQFTENWARIRSVKLLTLKFISMISPGSASMLVILNVGWSALAEVANNNAIRRPSMDLLIRNQVINVIKKT